MQELPTRSFEGWLSLVGQTVHLKKAVAKRIGAAKQECELSEVYGPGVLGLDVTMRTDKPPVRLAFPPEALAEHWLTE